MGAATTSFLWLMLQDFFQKECWAHHPKPHQEYIDMRRKQARTARRGAACSVAWRSLTACRQQQCFDAFMGGTPALQQRTWTLLSWTAILMLVHLLLQDESLAAERAKLVPGM